VVEEAIKAATSFTTTLDNRGGEVKSRISMIKGRKRKRRKQVGLVRL
jgi:hypothetical protein